MSALGHERTSRHVRFMSVISLKADISSAGLHVPLVPLADLDSRPRSILRQRHLLVRQAAIVDVEVWIKNGLALGAQENRLSLDHSPGFISSA